MSKCLWKHTGADSDMVNKDIKNFILQTNIFFALLVSQLQTVVN